MGLDQYLKAETYVSNYSFAPPEEREKFQTVVQAVGLDSIVSSDTPSATVRATVAYWRKANAIHGWFVDNVQGGEDDCRDYYVDLDQLRELRDTAAEALAKYEAGAPDEAGNLLTPRSGFFFGSTEIDDGFAADLKDTIAQLDRIIKADIGADYYYQSSW